MSKSAKKEKKEVGKPPHHHHQKHQHTSTDTKSEVTSRLMTHDGDTNEGTSVSPPPMDTLAVTVNSLRIFREDPPHYSLKVIFFGNVIINSIIKPLGLKQLKTQKFVAKGSMLYDPSNHIYMCKFADTPLVVHIQPLLPTGDIEETPAESQNPVMVPPSVDPSTAPPAGKSSSGRNHDSSGRNQTPSDDDKSVKDVKVLKTISICNIDILPLFIDQDKMCVRKRLEPMLAKRVMRRSSWDNLPLVELSLEVTRHEHHAQHHRLLQAANWMKITVVGVYNMATPHNDDYFYTVASKTPIYNEFHTEMQTYTQGIKSPRKFNPLRFYPRWETLRSAEENFTKGDEKFTCTLDDIQNHELYDLKYFLDTIKEEATVWGTFHRSLLLGDEQRWLQKHIRYWRWPLELHYYGEEVGGLSFMGFMDLFGLLYPGVTRQVLAVPLVWFDPAVMKVQCDCDILMLPEMPTAPGAATERPKSGKSEPTSSHASQSPGTTTTDETLFIPSTGANEKNCFLLVEVQLGQPLFPELHPPYITRAAMTKMLEAMQPMQGARVCQGRGQEPHAWSIVLRQAVRALSSVPNPGYLQFCSLLHQMAVLRTRMEIFNSFWMAAAIFVNNNFQVHNYLHSKESFEELLTMAHICMMNVVADTILPPSPLTLKVDAPILAARHARMLNDYGHAIKLYLQAVVKYPYDANYWRELSTCLKPVNADWARVCLNKALSLDFRHPVTLLAKGCMVFETDPSAAEPFFRALVHMYPFWPLANYVFIAYNTYIENFRMADVTLEFIRSLTRLKMTQEQPILTTWERELGDFWEPTLMLPGTSPFHTTADILLRLRAIRLAEVCLARGVSDPKGECAAYYHLVALCWFLREKYDNALCIVRKAIDTYGQNTYLLCLEALCLHQKDDTDGALAAYAKAGGGTAPYSVMMSLTSWEQARVRTTLLDLLRRQPTAYAWMALANDYMLRVEDYITGQPTEEQAEAVRSAKECAVQALRIDRCAGRAWALLAKLVKPEKRRKFCAQMAVNCGFIWMTPRDLSEFGRLQMNSTSDRLGSNIKECTCHLCEDLHM